MAAFISSTVPEAHQLIHNFIISMIMLIYIFLVRLLCDHNLRFVTSYPCGCT
ncbi:hypothetical protein NEOLEDRAFT_1138829 [Neolentinus lepideus HHB14362 ss-1]|uniref:Uncharacterized protein n=1 Tax=Neolentinus lepideus HHB14362 ss-1 TaxID=1314782 RepID=A0A165Q2L8_9AGAM|nr:hypothetical protein NEOLEDRAFT_1138829 [Neolentinus lepideus HHB14362 ss-1]